MKIQKHECDVRRRSTPAREREFGTALRPCPRRAPREKSARSMPMSFHHGSQDATDLFFVHDIRDILGSAFQIQAWRFAGRPPSYIRDPRPTLPPSRFDVPGSMVPSPLAFVCLVFFAVPPPQPPNTILPTFGFWIRFGLPIALFGFVSDSRLRPATARHVELRISDLGAPMFLLPFFCLGFSHFPLPGNVRFRGGHPILVRMKFIERKTEARAARLQAACPSEPSSILHPPSSPPWSRGPVVPWSLVIGHRSFRTAAGPWSLVIGPSLLVVIRT
jgi:hypothetical protein